MTSNGVDHDFSAHVTGLADLQVADLEAIERRRTRLWSSALVALFVILIAVAALFVVAPAGAGIALPAGLALATGLAGVAAVGFVSLRRETRLRALTERLLDDRVLAASLDNSLRESQQLIENGRQANIRLEPDHIYKAILDSAIDLLQAQGGSIMRAEGHSQLQTVCFAGKSAAGGARIDFHDGIAGRVASTRKPLLIGGTVDWTHYVEDDTAPRPSSAMCVPLTSGDHLMGVLNINAKPPRIYDQRDLAVVARYGEQAGTAIANAETYESQRRARLRGRTQAMHDPLTGLPNRTLLMDRLGTSLARRRPPGHGVVLMFIDLDDFKKVNDSLGHTAGDEALVAVADRLRTSVRAGDSVAHFGGDEFAILLEAKDAQEATGAANRILGEMAKPFPVEGRDVQFTASAGIALEHSGEIHPEEVMRRAFNALHAAKDRGRGQIAVFDESMHENAIDRLDLENELRFAVNNKSLDVHFQPLIDLKNMSVHGFEALVRWNHPDRGLVSAARFVPLAEQAGLQPRIDRLVLQRTCARFKALNESIFAAKPALAHVNLSPLTIREADFVANLAHDLEQSGLDPDHLVLEITESVIMHDVEQAASRLRAIKALGVRLALDDFGTGYSSLSYLRSFPVDVVKIDKIFVDEIEDDNGAAALVQAILRLGTGLTFEVVAEGIETKEQMHSLLDMGCRYGQGYYLARPLSPPQLAEFLEGIETATVVP
jgi:diguanylate cyclase (GGDEF)-like protein